MFSRLKYSNFTLLLIFIYFCLPAVLAGITIYFTNITNIGFAFFIGSMYSLIFIVIWWFIDQIFDGRTPI